MPHKKNMVDTSEMASESAKVEAGGKQKYVSNGRGERRVYCVAVNVPWKPTWHQIDLEFNCKFANRSNTQSK